MCIADGVFGETAMWSHHLVEGGDAVTGLELDDIGTDGVDNAGDVVACVQGVACLGPLPVFGIGARHDDFDGDLVFSG